jgi:Zn-dependent protease
MDVYNIIIKICVNAVPLVLAITLHEAAHGYVARMFGDNTAYMLGRVTLNPAKHIDPVGTIVFPLISMIVGGIIFGWAKPVPVNFSNLRHPKRDMLWVAAAGPGSNIVQACVWAIGREAHRLRRIHLGRGGVLVRRSRSRESPGTSCWRSSTCSRSCRWTAGGW